MFNLWWRLGQRGPSWHTPCPCGQETRTKRESATTRCCLQNQRFYRANGQNNVAWSVAGFKEINKTSDNQQWKYCRAFQLCHSKNVKFISEALLSWVVRVMRGPQGVREGHTDLTARGVQTAQACFTRTFLQQNGVAGFSWRTGDPPLQSLSLSIWNCVLRLYKYVYSLQ